MASPRLPQPGERSRALRFIHPDFDVSIAAHGVPDAPGLQLGPGGGLTMVQGAASVRQALLLLLSTAPGERVMRSGYGCELRRLLFCPNDDTTAGLAIHYVRQAIGRWEPRVELLHVDASPHPDTAGLLEMLLEYRVRETEQRDRLTFSVDLSGEAR